MKKGIYPYKKDSDFSYVSGAYATIELIHSYPEQIETVYIHSRFDKPEEMEKICRSHHVHTEHDDRIFLRMNQKENSYVLCTFKKYQMKINLESSHVILVNPADMGNLGTIIRTLAGLSHCDLALITPAADIWNPKTIRASMGAIFHIRFEHFENIDQYLKRFAAHELYPFMLNGKVELRPENLALNQRYSLIFGNEATGLDESYYSLGTSVRIPQRGVIDSLNLSSAVAIGTYVFGLQTDSCE